MSDHPSCSGANDPSISFRGKFSVASVSVELNAALPQDVALVPFLERFRDDTPIPDITVRVERTQNLGPDSRPRVFDSGSTWRLYEDGSGFQFDFYAAPFGERPYRRLFVNQRFDRATLQINKFCTASRFFVLSPVEYPLDELLIMHRLTQEKAIELHGCGIVRADGIGNLFVGHSGAGKSTTTRLWTAREDVEVLSDDRIIVRRESAEKQVPHRRFAPVRNDNVKHKIRMYGTPWHGEAMYASPNSAPLARIFVLEHGHGNILTPLSSSQAVAELFARSFVPFHRHEYIDSALSFLQELVDAIPVYRFSFEPDQRAVDTILNLRD